MQQLKRKTLSGIKGMKSSMAGIEPCIVSLIIQLVNMRVPIAKLQGLQFCNSIINSAINFKAALLSLEKNFRMVTKELGPGYWCWFLNKNKHLIRMKKAMKFNTICTEWCTYLYLEEMHNEVYSHPLTSGLAVKHEEPVWWNKTGEVVSCEKETFGLKSVYEVIHPKWLVFVDKVGSNTSQANDGAVSGQTYLCTKDGHPQQWEATKDCHFTILGFTAANG